MSRLLTQLRAVAREQEIQDQLIRSAQAAYVPTEFVIVNNIADLPAPSGGVITLGANVTYLFPKAFDLNGNRLVCGQNTVILGWSSENCSLFSTGLSASTALITSNWSLPMRHITITHGTALDLDASANPNQALDWTGVNFTNCATVGTIKGYNNVVLSVCALLGSANLKFDGTIGTVAVDNTLLSGIAGQTTVVFPFSFVTTRRIRFTYSAFVVPAGGTGINLAASATVPVERYILDTVEFSGAGSPISGVTAADNKSLFTNCIGVQNTSASCAIYMVNNATATTVSATGTFYKIAGTTTAGSAVQRFSTATTNRMTYTGASSAVFRVMLIVSLSAGSTQVIRMRIAKNGVTLEESQARFETTVAATGRAFCVSCQAIITLAPNDYLEPFIANDTSATNITANDLTFTVARVF